MSKLLSRTRLKILAAAAALALLGAGAAAQNLSASPSSTAISVTVGNVVVIGTLNDTPTSRDLIAQLPLTMRMTRALDREYYGRPGAPLSAVGEKRSGFENGHIGYWTPGGYVAFFFDNSVNPDLDDVIVMGDITSDLAVFDGLGPSAEMTIDLAGNAEEQP